MRGHISHHLREHNEAWCQLHVVFFHGSDRGLRNTMSGAYEVKKCCAAGCDELLVALSGRRRGLSTSRVSRGWKTVVEGSGLNSTRMTSLASPLALGRPKLEQRRRSAASEVQLNYLIQVVSFAGRPRLLESFDMPTSRRHNLEPQGECGGQAPMIPWRPPRVRVG